jgi:hypothetical protein
MMTLTHKFVETIPEELENSVIYVSMPFATAIHKCCCGCGKQVVTPLSPTAWRLTFDGRNVSLYPSIGNWSFPCKSHYWIRNNQVHWATEWDAETISNVRAAEDAERQEYYRGYPYRSSIFRFLKRRKR